MKNLRLQNYRCFEDTGEVELRPLTILIGANSSGKSSLLKFFPLLKQSVGEYVQGMLLWTGSLIDFKDFGNTLKDGTNEMGISFDIKDLKILTRSLLAVDQIVDVHVEVKLMRRDDNPDYECLKSLLIVVNGQKYKISSPDGQKARLIVGKADSQNLGDDVILGSTNSFLPPLFFKTKGQNSEEESEKAYREMKKFFSEDGRSTLFQRSVIRTLHYIFDRGKLKEQISKSRYINVKNTDEEVFQNLLQYYAVNILIDSINFYLIQLAGNIQYIKPLRAIVERYYRYTNISVNEISADGSNLPSYYNSLKKTKFDLLNRWLESSFGFTVKLVPLEGHMELQIKQKETNVRNLVDVGFGYTQILPILTILWKIIWDDDTEKRNVRRLCKTHIVAIEQPELHLHPRFQGMFATMLARLIYDGRQQGIDLRILVETHSEVIINRLGELIADANESLQSEDVNVLIFNGKSEGLEKEVSVAQYDKEGYIHNWPYGFFSDYVYRD